MRVFQIREKIVTLNSQVSQVHYRLLTDRTLIRPSAAESAWERPLWAADIAEVTLKQAEQ